MRFWGRGKVEARESGGRVGEGMGWKEMEGRVRSSRSSLMVKEACVEGQLVCLEQSGHSSRKNICANGVGPNLHRPPPSNNPHPLYSTPCQLFQRILRDICLPQPIHPTQQHPRHIQCHVPLPNDHRLVRILQPRVQATIPGIAIIPSHKVPRRVYPLERIFSWDIQFLIPRCTVREDEGIVMRDD